MNDLQTMLGRRIVEVRRYPHEAKLTLVFADGTWRSFDVGACDVEYVGAVAGGTVNGFGVREADGASVIQTDRGDIVLVPARHAGVEG